ncbi:PCP reductase family protein [Okeania sp. SIO1I7]|nr:PCP reductase family protein [Okeania sp. SIO1I7]
MNDSNFNHELQWTPEAQIKLKNIPYFVPFPGGVARPNPV